MVTIVQYFTDATLGELKGEIVLSTVKSVVPFSQVRRECGIEIVTADRVYVFAVGVDMNLTLSKSHCPSLCRRTALKLKPAGLRPFPSQRA
jgi:hypothetical protein